MNLFDFITDTMIGGSNVAHVVPREAMLRAYHITSRDPRLERVISRDAYNSYLYARDIVGGRFQQGEEAIARDPGYSYYYARDVIGGRFPLGEPAISANLGWDGMYTSFIHSRKGQLNPNEPRYARLSS